jgi:hypothetical protein
VDLFIITGEHELQSGLDLLGFVGFKNIDVENLEMAGPV